MLLKNYLTLLAIGLIWGSQFIFQEMALMSFSPVWIGTFRATVGAITLVLICRVMGIKSVSRQWGLFALIGLFEAAIPFVLVPWGQENLASAVAAILMGTLPFYVLILGPVFIQGATISIGNAVSVVIGFSGLLCLFYPELSSGSGGISLVSCMAVMAAAVSFAIALLLLNRVRNEHPLIVARNVLVAASVLLMMIASVTTPPEIEGVFTPAVFSLGYLGVMCAGVVYYLYMISIKNAGAVFTSMTNYLVPAVGVLIGALLADESISATTWIALAVILFALLINQLLSVNEQKP